jgi:hypothetical protein
MNRTFPGRDGALRRPSTEARQDHHSKRTAQRTPRALMLLLLLLKSPEFTAVAIFSLKAD